MGALGINLLPLLTGVGFMGAAIAFGSQTLVRDVVTGFFVLLEDQFAVGETVKAGGVKGVVESLTMRTTRIRTEDGALVMVPNGQLGAVTNFSRPGRARKEDPPESGA